MTENSLSETEELVSPDELSNILENASNQSLTSSGDQIIETAEKSLFDTVFLCCPFENEVSNVIFFLKCIFLR